MAGSGDHSRKKHVTQTQTKDQRAIFWKSCTGIEEDTHGIRSRLITFQDHHHKEMLKMWQVVVRLWKGPLAIAPNNPHDCAVFNVEPGWVRFCQLRRDPSSLVSRLPRDIVEYCIQPLMLPRGRITRSFRDFSQPYRYSVCTVCCQLRPHCIDGERCLLCPLMREPSKICRDCHNNNKARADNICRWHVPLPSEPMETRLCWSCLGTELPVVGVLNLCELCPPLENRRCTDCLQIACTECAWHRRQDDEEEDDDDAAAVVAPLLLAKRAAKKRQLERD
jgi:hypothetical protein